MGEHVPDDGSLTAEEARDTIARLEAFEAPLRRRTGGITWMIWAIATAGIFVTYRLAQMIALDGPLLWFLWAPWVASGWVLTAAVWNSVAITLGLPADEEARRGTAIGVAITVFFFAAAWAINAVAVPLPASAYWLGLFGGFTLVMGGWTCRQATDRTASFVAGGALLTAAAVDALVGLPFAGFVAVIAGVWIAAGAFMAFRG